MSKRLALLALAAVCFVGACGGDDSDESGTDDSAGSAETTQPEASGGEGYTPAMRSNFMNACVAQPGATEAKCECTLDEDHEHRPGRGLRRLRPGPAAGRCDPATELARSRRHGVQLRPPTAGARL